MRTTDRPLPRPDLDFDVVDGEGLVLSPDGPRLHRLNHSAMAAFLACDGEHDLAGVVAEVMARFDVAPTDPRVRDQLVGVVDELVALDLVRTTDRERPAPLTAPCDQVGEHRAGADGQLHLLVPESACRDGLERVGWAGQLAVAVGKLRLGVHTDTLETAAWARQVLGDAVVDDPAAPPNVRVERGRRPDGSGDVGRRPGVYDGHRWVGGSDDEAALARLLRARVAAAAPLPGDLGHLVRLRLEGLVTDGGVVLRPAFPRPAAPGELVLPAPVLVEPGRRVVLDVDPRLAGPGGPAVLPLAGAALGAVPTEGPPDPTPTLRTADALDVLAGYLHLAPTESAAGRLAPLVALARAVSVDGAPGGAAAPGR